MKAPRLLSIYCIPSPVRFFTYSISRSRFLEQITLTSHPESSTSNHLTLQQILQKGLLSMREPTIFWKFVGSAVLAGMKSTSEHVLQFI